MRSRSATTLAGLLLLTGCGASTGQAAPETTLGGHEPTTPQALAAVAVEYAGKPTSATRLGDVDEYDKGAVGAELRYNAGGEYDGDVLAVAVGTGLTDGEIGCHDETRDAGTCVTVGEGILTWEPHAPEEDPGTIVVVVAKGDTQVLVMQAGPVVDGDPRELDLPISVEDMFALAQDARVDRTTSQATLDAGAALDFWEDRLEG